MPAPADENVLVVTLRGLPAGTYVIWAKATLTRGAAVSPPPFVAGCTLLAGDARDNANAVAPDLSGIGVSVSPLLATTFTATASVTLSCSMTGSSSNISRARIIAVRVGSLTTS